MQSAFLGAAAAAEPLSPLVLGLATAVAVLLAMVIVLGVLLCRTRSAAASSPGAMGSGGTAKQKKKHYSRTAGGKVGDEDVEQILYGDDHLEME